MSQVKRGKLSDFRPQKNNANVHTERGLKMLDDSYSEVGYVAPITAAADGEILDGSARLERAFNHFPDDALVIHHDGKKPVIMVRDDIPRADTPQAKKISYGANRTGEVDLSWDSEAILADQNAGLDLGQFWSDDELDALEEEAMLAAELAAAMLGDIDSSPDRDLGDKRKQIKPVLYAEEVGIFEKAIKLTGLQNRGQALIAICEYYLNETG